eukprot:3197227-Rhodomonas_salina.1
MTTSKTPFASPLSTLSVPPSLHPSVPDSQSAPSYLLPVLWPEQLTSRYCESRGPLRGCAAFRASPFPDMIRRAISFQRFHAVCVGRLQDLPGIPMYSKHSGRE